MAVKRSAFKRLSGDAGWALLGQVGSGLLLLAGLRLLTEWVSPDEYGQVALMIGIVALGVSIFSYPFICAGMRLLPEHQASGTVHGLYRQVSRLTVASTLTALLLLAIGGGLHVRLTGSDPWLFAGAGLLLAITVQREMGIQLLIGERRQREASLWQTTDGMLRPALAVVAVVLGGPKAPLILLGYALATGLANAVWSWRRKPSALDERPLEPAAIRSIRAGVLAYALPLIPVELLLWFSGLGDRYVIGCLLTASDVGIYAAAYTLVNEAFNRSAMVLLRTFQPAYFQACSQGEEAKAGRLFATWLGCVIAMGAMGVIALWFMKDLVAGWLLAERYHAAAVLMPLIGAGCALQALSMVLSQPLLATKRTSTLLGGRVLGAASAAMGLPLMVQQYGLMGAALAAPVYYGVEALGMALLAKPWRMASASEQGQTCPATGTVG